MAQSTVRCRAIVANFTFVLRAIMTESIAA